MRRGFQVMPCESQIGGGSLPLERIPSYAAAISPEEMSVPELEEKDATSSGADHPKDGERHHPSGRPDHRQPAV